MTDREKVISDIKDIINYVPIYKIEETLTETLELLKAQEPAEAETEGGGTSWWYVCGECHGTIDQKDRYCRHCGREIRWK